MGRVKKVDLYENGTIAIVEAVSPELGNRVQRVRVQLPGTSQVCAVVHSTVSLPVPHSCRHMFQQGTSAGCIWKTAEDARPEQSALTNCSGSCTA